MLTKLAILILCVFLLAGTLLASDTLEVRDFTPGLQTVKGKFDVPIGGAEIAHNVDLSEASLRIRSGYDSVYTFTGIDFWTGIYGAYYEDGQQQLVAALDSTGVGYGALYASEMGTHVFGVQKDSFEVSMDIVSAGNYGRIGYPVDSFFDTIAVNGRSYVLVYDMFLIDSSKLWHDSAWLVDTMVQWINDSIGDYLTAFDNGAELIVSEDTTGIETIFKLDYKDVTAYNVITTGPASFWPYWSTQNPTSFSQYNDLIYAVNGDQRGVVWNGEVAHAYPLPAFGEPLVTPISLQSGENGAYVIDGEVRYALRHYYKRGGSNVYNIGPLGPISAPVKTKNGRFLLRGFALMPLDSVMDSISVTTVIPSEDTLIYVLYRTNVNPGRIDETTRLYSTSIHVKITAEDSCIVVNTSGTFDTTKFTSLKDVIVIDSLPDSTINRLDAVGVLAIDNEWAGRDSLGVMNRRSGAPTFISSTSYQVTISDTLLGDSDGAFGLFRGIPFQKDTLGFAYAIAPIDTLTGNEGPLSSWATIFNFGADADTGVYAFSVTLGLPPLPPNDSGIAYNLYRAIILQIGPTQSVDTIIEFNTEGLGMRNPTGKISKWLDMFTAIDTVVIYQPYLVAQIPAVDTIYTDSMRYDSLDLRREYTQVTPPPRINRLVAYDKHMFATDGSWLYRSILDSVIAWGFWDRTPVNTSDGTRITNLWPFRGGMRIKKDRTSWNAFQDYGKTEINDGFGCIGPYSHIKGAAHYFLGHRGIEMETEGKYLERAVNSDLLSKNINSFEGRTITDLSAMQAFYVQSEQLALFSLGDTTWAFFEKTGAWATWSMTFKGATLFDTEDDLNFQSGNTMYFFQDNDPNLYRYAKSQTDNGVNISMEWRSGILGTDRWQYVIDDVGLWVTSTDGGDSLLTVTIYGDDGSATGTIVYPTLANESYILKEFGSKTPMYYYQIGITNSGSISGTAIDKLDFTRTRADDTRSR